MAYTVITRIASFAKIEFPISHSSYVVFIIYVYMYMYHVDCVHSLMLRKSGLSTDGDTDSVRLVGPIAPITYRGTPVTMDIWQYV